MLDPSDLVSRLVPGAQSLSAPFAAMLLLHVPAGLASVVAGAVAAASPKRRGRHPSFGTVYYWALVLGAGGGLRLGDGHGHPPVDGGPPPVRARDRLVRPGVDRLPGEEGPLERMAELPHPGDEPVLR